MDKLYSKNILLLLYYWTCIGIPFVIYSKIFNCATISNCNETDFISNSGNLILQLFPPFIMIIISFFIATGITLWHRNTDRNTLKKIVFVNLTILLLFSAYMIVFKNNVI